MTTQTQIDFVHVQENTHDNRVNLELQRPRFNKQCSLVLDLLRSGVRLTCLDAMVKYGVGHLPRRVKDLRENGIEIKSEWIEINNSRFKEYWIDNSFS